MRNAEISLGRACEPDRSLWRCSSPVRPPPEPATGPETFVPRLPRRRFSELVLPASTRRTIETLLSRVRNHDLLYGEWELGTIDPVGRHKTVSFYGPPGTGKTQCAEALAAELGQPIIEVDYAAIESKYVGETPKNIRAAFEAARSAGAVLFFDEADSILGRRLTQVTQAADQAVNVSRAVLLKELDAFDGVVVFATNLARNFDSAFVRRILLHVEVPLPDAEGRRLLWQRMISDRVPGREEIDWDRLTEASQGFSGGDIKNAVVLCLAAAADRTDAARRITLEDGLEAIRHVRRAKEEVEPGSHVSCE